MKRITGWNKDAWQRAARVRLVALDVDGVLTDGGLWYSSTGDELKGFHVRDGLGIRLLQEAGIPVGIITARSSPLVERRAAELKLAFVVQGAGSKWKELQAVLAGRAVELAECAYMGDDLIDLGILARVGLGCAPRDAVPEVRHLAHWIAPRPGGEGAVRAMAEGILRAQGEWMRIIRQVVG